MELFNIELATFSLLAIFSSATAILSSMVISLSSFIVCLFKMPYNGLRLGVVADF
jgi:hypothetical protein